MDTKRRSPLVLMMVLVLVAAMVLPAMARGGPRAVADAEINPIALRQDIVGLTAAEILERGISNNKDNCGPLEPGEVGWHFVTTGQTGQFADGFFRFGGGADRNVLEADKEQRTGGQNGQLRGVYFITNADETFEGIYYNKEDEEGEQVRVDDFVLGSSNHNLFNLSNVCVPEVSITIEKETEDLTDDTVFEFTLLGPDPVLMPNENNGGPMGATFGLKSGESKTFDYLILGEYTIAEAVPGGWKLIDITCEVDPETAGTWEDEIPGVTVDLRSAPAAVTCTFTNKPQGAIAVAKTYSAIGGGELTPDVPAQFTLDPKFDEEGNFIEGSGIPVPKIRPGFYCVDGLDFGDYELVETLVPFGFEGAAPRILTVEDVATCDDPEIVVEIDNQASPIELDVRKFKLDFDDELGFVTTDTALRGWTFQLYAGTNVNVRFIERAVTGADGVAQFDAPLAIGETYTVCEIAAPNPGGGIIGRDGTYWTLPYRALGDEVGSAVEPWGGILGRCSTITPELGAEDMVIDFYNAPKADISLSFTDVTGYTTATLACYDADGEFIEEVSLDGTGSLDLSELVLGDYTCEVEIRNGTDGS